MDVEMEVEWKWEMEWVVLDYAVGVTSPALYCPSIARDRVSLTWSEILLWPKVSYLYIYTIGLDR